MNEYARKLYEVTVSITYYAYGYVPDAAMDYAEDAVRDAILSEVTEVREVKHKEHHLAPGWDDGNLIYCHGFDTTLGEALAKLPSKFDVVASDETRLREAMKGVGL